MKIREFFSKLWTGVKKVVSFVLKNFKTIFTILASLIGFIFIDNLGNIFSNSNKKDFNKKKKEIKKENNEAIKKANDDVKESKKVIVDVKTTIEKIEKNKDERNEKKDKFYK